MRMKMKKILMWIGVLAAAFGLYVAFARLLVNADRGAIRNAVKEGRLSPQEAEEMLGEPVVHPNEIGKGEISDKIEERGGFRKQFRKDAR